MFDENYSSAQRSQEDAQDENSLGNGKGQGRWTDEEHERFVEGLRMYGKDWQMVEDHIGSRNSAQIRSHAQKFLSKMEKEGN